MKVKRIVINGKAIIAFVLTAAWLLSLALPGYVFGESPDIGSETSASAVSMESAAAATDGSEKTVASGNGTPVGDAADGGSETALAQETAAENGEDAARGDSSGSGGMDDSTEISEPEKVVTAEEDSAETVPSTSDDAAETAPEAAEETTEASPEAAPAETENAPATEDQPVTSEEPAEEPITEESEEDSAEGLAYAFGAGDITTQDELESAMAALSTDAANNWYYKVTLTQNIELTRPLAIPGDRGFTLDGAGFSLTLADGYTGKHINHTHSADAGINFSNIVFDGEGVGGGVALSGRSPGVDLDVEGSVFKNCVGTDGGALYLKGGVAQIGVVTFSGNKATNGGALYIDSGTAFGSIVNVYFTENTATEGGGAIFTKSANPLTISRSTFTGNAARFGGAICAMPGADIKIYNPSANPPSAMRSAFANNTARGDGGAIYAVTSKTATTSITVDGYPFENNIAGGNGGAWFNDRKSAKLTLKNTTVSGNKALDQGSFPGYEGKGGALSGGVLEITNTHFKNNESARFGGAIYSPQQDKALIPAAFQDVPALTISGGSFIGNKAGLFGGAIEVYTPNETKYVGAVDGTTFKDNWAGNGYYYLDYTRPIDVVSQTYSADLMVKQSVVGPQYAAIYKNIASITPAPEGSGLPDSENLFNNFDISDTSNFVVYIEKGPEEGVVWKSGSTDQIRAWRHYCSIPMSELLAFATSQIERPGYMVVGWTSNSEKVSGWGSGPISGDETLRGYINMVPVWAEAVNVTYHLNDTVSKGDAGNPYGAGDTVTAKLSPTDVDGGWTAVPVGKVFAGWDSDADGNMDGEVDVAAGADFIIAGNTNLYAVWADGEPDWARLRRAINEYNAETITIYPKGAGVVEDLSKGTLTLVNEQDSIISDGSFINVGRDVKLKAADGKITLITPEKTPKGAAIGYADPPDSGEILWKPSAANSRRHFSITSGDAVRFAFENVVIDGDGYGGGVFVQDTTVTMTGAEIKDCVAGHGGGILTKVSDQTASGSESFIFSGSVTGCKAQGDTSISGGGISAHRVHLTLNGSITDCTTSGSGGGVMISAGDLLVQSGSVLSDNHATQGGGINIQSDSKLWPTLTIEKNVTLEKNTATQSGGGAYAGEGIRILMQGGLIKENASREGGGIYARGNSGRSDAGIILNGGTISGNKSSAYGAGIYSSTPITLAGAAISGNIATGSGGGVCLWPDISRVDSMTGVPHGAPVLTQTSGDITANKSAGYAGGVFVNAGASYALQGGALSENESGWYGGGVYLNTSSSMAISGGEVSGNKALSASYGVGGGIYVNSKAALTMSDGKISGNKATAQGGGVCVNAEAAFTMSSVGEISGNKVGAGGYGGGVYLNPGGAIKMTGGKVNDNEASYGGGIFGGGNASGSGSAIVMTNGEISENKATAGGGGIFLTPNSSFVMSAGKISGNKAAAGNGGGIHLNAANADKALIDLQGGEVSGNTAAGDGGGVFTTHFEKVRVADAVSFTGNKAQAAYWLEKTDASNIGRYATPYPYYYNNVKVGGENVDGLKTLHTKNIKTAARSAQPSGADTFDYLYNNYDVNFTYASYKLVYDGNGNTGGNAPTDANGPYPAGNTVKVLDKGSLTKTGYAFAGWVLTAVGETVPLEPEKDHGIVINGELADDAGTITLYARWTPDTYAIIFKGNGGTGGMDAQTATYDENLTLTANAFVKTGHFFGGWNTVAAPDEGDPGVSYTDGQSFTPWKGVSGLTLYAQWTPKDVETLFMTNTSEDDMSAYAPGVTANKDKKFGDRLATFADPERVGYTFEGWFTARSGGDKWDFAQDAIATDGQTILYAQWTPKVYTVTFVDHDGAVLKTQQVASGGNATPPTDPSRDGYDFAEWSGSYVNIMGDITITAIYRPVPPAPEPPAPMPSEPPAPKPSAPKPPAASGAPTPAPTAPVITTVVTERVETVVTERVVVETEIVEAPVPTVEPPEVTAPEIQPEEPTVVIQDTIVPQVSAAYWALLNLILAIIGVALAVVTVMRRRSGRKYDAMADDEYADHETGKTGWMILSLVLGVVGVILFVLTENMNNTMVLADKWTLVQAAVFVVEIIGVALAWKRAPEGDAQERLGEALL